MVGAVPRTHMEARGGSCADVEEFHKILLSYMGVLEAILEPTRQIWIIFCMQP